MGSVEAGDVTDDGVTDFVVRLVGLDAAGGVYSRERVRLRACCRSTLTSGQTDWVVDGLQLDLGRLESERREPPSAPASRSTWTWTGREFEVRG